MKQQYVKILASTCAVVLITSFFLFVMGKISDIVFWVVAIVCFVVAYKGLPVLNPSKKK